MVLVVSFSSSSRVDSHERLEDNEKAIPLLLFLSAATFPGPVHSGVLRQHCSLISQGSTVTIAELKPSIVDFWLALPFRKWSVNNEDNSFILSLGVVALPCKEAKKEKEDKDTETKPSFSARRRALGLCARLWRKPLVFSLTYCHLLVQWCTNSRAIIGHYTADTA